MKKIQFIIIFLHLMVCAHAQFIPEFSSEIPPLPESAVFRDHTGYPPSLSTGAANVNIPLYEVQVGDFTLPIALNYYTSGIKVEDVADPVGYGWTFSPGLRITRTTRGRPDEAFPKKPYDQIMNGQFENFMYGKRAMMDYPSRTEEDIAFDKVIGINTVIDTQYDIFTLNLPQINEFFVYEEKDQIVCVNHLIKIVAKEEGKKIVGFEVTDEKGIYYYFGCYPGENQNVTPPHVEKPTYSSHFTAWGLRKIKFPDSQHEIHITWGKVYTLPHFNQSYNANLSYTDYRGPKDPFAFGVPEFYYGQLVEREPQQSLRIQEIQFPGGKVTFTYSNSNYQSLLSSLRVRNNVNDLVRDIDFEYNTNGTQLLSKLTTSHEGVYRFSYHSKRFTHILSQDYWGYNNGKVNQTLIPKFELRAKHPYTYTVYEFGGADRSVDVEYSKANILTRVDYPTGGYTAFEYEPHEFTEIAPTIVENTSALTKGRGLRVCKMVTRSDASSPPIIKTYKYYDPILSCNNTLDSFIDRFWYAYLLIVQPDVDYPSDTQYTARKNYVNAQSFASSLFLSTPSVFYTKVEEYTNDTHKAQYEFVGIMPDDFSSEPRPFVRSHRLISGQREALKRKIIYKRAGEDYEPIEEISYTYGTFFIAHKDNYVNMQFMNLLYPNYSTHFTFSEDINGIQYAPSAVYYIMTTYIDIQRRFLEKESRIVYTDVAVMNDSTKYIYDGEGLLREKKVFSSGDEIVENYTYLNGTSYPRLISRTRSGRKMSQQIDYNNGYLPYCVYLYKGDSRTSNDVKILYNRYNMYGKPLSVTLKGVADIVYIWGYNSLLPIAEIKNATINDVLSFIPESTLNSIAHAAVPTSEQLALVNSLRFQLPKSQISTYTYKPLIGMTSATDPSGATTFYDYHSDGRLKEVYLIKDGVKTSLKRYEYFIKNNPL